MAQSIASKLSMLILQVLNARLERGSMKYILEANFETDDFDPEEGELVEDIRREIRDVIANYTLTENPTIKIREDN